MRKANKSLKRKGQTNPQIPAPITNHKNRKKDKFKEHEDQSFKPAQIILLSIEGNG